jgi:SPP1 gp7 family putative phage head morphogenesis protein
VPASYNLDQILMHEVYLDKLNTGYINRSVYPALEETYKLIRRILIEDGLPKTPKQLANIESLIAQLIKEQSAWDNYTKDMQEAALYEMKYLAGQAELTSLSNRALFSFIGEQMMVLTAGTKSTAGFWKDYVAANNESTANTINNLVKSAYARNETISQVLKGVRQQFQGSIKADAVAMARTAFAHYTQQARRALVASNEKYYRDAIFVAVWDNRTTLICRGFAGERFPANDPKLPIPPLHYGCRSTLVYGPKGFRLTGQRAAIGGKLGEEAKKLYDKRSSSYLNEDGERVYPNKVIRKGKRDDNIFEPETLASDSSHEAWLRRQPMWFIESALGKNRAILFKRGNLPLKRFTDMTGKQLTIKELSVLDKDVFIRLGLATG